MARTKQQKTKAKNAGWSNDASVNSGDGVPVKSEEVDDVRPEEAYSNHPQMAEAQAQYTCRRCDVAKDLSCFSAAQQKKIDQGKSPTCKECAEQRKQERQDKVIAKRGHLERTCAICEQLRNGSDYTSNQWRKGEGQSKCSICRLPDSAQRNKRKHLCSECKSVKNGSEFTRIEWNAGDAARCASCAKAEKHTRKREKRETRQKSPDPRVSKKSKPAHEHEALASNIGPRMGNLIQTPLNADSRGFIQPVHLIWSAISKLLISPNEAELQARTLEEVRIRGIAEAQEMLASRLANLVYRTTCALKDSSPHVLSQLVTTLSEVVAYVDSFQTGGLWTFPDLFHSTFVNGAKVVFQKHVVSSAVVVLSRLGDGIVVRSTLNSVECIGEAIVLSGSLVVTPLEDLISLLSMFVSYSKPHRRLFEAAASSLECTVPTLAPSALSKLSHVFARARFAPPKLFEYIERKSSSDVTSFGFDDAIILVESFAELGLAFDIRKFSVLLLSEDSINHASGGQLASIAWILALANVDCVIPTSFVRAVTQIHLRKGFEDNELGRVYMWHLWMVHEMKKPGLPPQYVNDFMTGIAQSNNSSDNAGLLNDIVMNMTPGLQYMTEVKSNSGTIVDLLVKVDKRTVAVFAESTGQFCGRRPCGSLLLKRRQIQTVDNLELVSIPSFDWINLKSIQAKRQYLDIVIVLGGNVVAYSCRTKDKGGELSPPPLGSGDAKKAGPATFRFA